MGFLNSVVNQMGRELGRDIYNSSMSSLKPKTQKSEVENLYDEISSYKPAKNDKTTIKQLESLIDRVSNLPATSNDVLNLYFDLDEKIDLCKDFVDEKNREEIEKLDITNSKLFDITLVEYKNRIDEKAKAIKVKIDSYVAPDKWKIRTLRLWDNDFSISNFFSALWIVLILCTFSVGTQPVFYSLLVILSIFLLISITLRESKIKDMIKVHNDNVELYDSYQKILELV